MIPKNRREIILSGAAVLCAPSSFLHASEVELELVFGFDCSGSMYTNSSQIGPTHEWLRHYKIQLQGHILALQDREIRGLLVEKRVLIRVIGWGQTKARNLTQPVLISAEADIDRLIDEIGNSVPKSSFEPAGTRHQTGIEHVLGQRRIGVRRIFDLITDETVKSDDVAACNVARDEAYATGTTINVMAISLDSIQLSTIHTYLRTPDGFVLALSDWSQYYAWVRMKIFRELRVG